MKKYFEHNVDDAERIAVVDGDVNESDFGDEIDSSELPNDFGNWKKYTAYAAADGCTVNVMSRDGD